LKKLLDTFKTITDTEKTEPPSPSAWMIKLPIDIQWVTKHFALILQQRVSFVLKVAGAREKPLPTTQNF
jgi:hypothetical protein